MPPSNGMYDKENIGNLYYTANDEDFVILKLILKEIIILNFTQKKDIVNLENTHQVVLC